MAEATPDNVLQRIWAFFAIVKQRTAAIIEAQNRVKLERAALLEEINRRRREIPPEQRGGLMQGFLERMRAVRDAGKTQKAQAKEEFNEALREEIDRKAVPNQQAKSLYSNEEIMTGKAIEFVRELKVQAQNSEAEARYTDLGEKMGMRVGIDGAAGRPE